jgi:DNA-directed RNA polymerase specialized sigma24 family protein
MQIIQELPNQYRLFLLYVLDDYSHKEIACTISTGTTKSNLARAQ